MSIHSLHCLIREKSPHLNKSVNAEAVHPPNSLKWMKEDCLWPCDW